MAWLKALISPSSGGHKTFLLTQTRRFFFRFFLSFSLIIKSHESKICCYIIGLFTAALTCHHKFCTWIHLMERTKCESIIMKWNGCSINFPIHMLYVCHYLPWLNWNGVDERNISFYAQRKLMRKNFNNSTSEKCRRLKAMVSGGLRWSSPICNQITQR